MSRVINFVQDRTKQAKVQDAQDQKILKKAVFVLIGCAIVAGVALGGRVFSSLTLSRAEQVFATTKSSLALSEQQQNQYAAFMQKVGILTEIYQERRDKQEALAFFRTLFDQGVSISGLSYDDKDKELTFSLTADSVFVLEMVLNRIDSPETRAKYPDVAPSSLRRGADGKYTTNITVTL